MITAPVKGSQIEKQMKKIYVILPLACALTFTACDDYDDTALWEQVNDNTGRIEALEEWQQTTNSNIAALQQLISTTDYITSVTPVTENGKEIGYTITFLHSDPITIYHGEKGDKGEDGTAGSTPQIGLTQQTDGNWYWTLNGELMTDSKGNPIRANGEDGKDGEDGQDGADGDDGSTGATGRPGTSAPTPQIKLGSSLTTGTYYGINGDKQTTPDAGAWYLSVNNGATWYRVSGEDGQSGSTGDSFFKKVDTSNPNYVTFTLADGTTFKVSRINDGKNVVDVSTAGGLQQALTDAGINASTVTELTITGTLGDADFTYMKENLSALNQLDLSGLDITVLPESALQGMPFETIVLPNGLKEIKDNALKGCKSLRTLEIPESVEKLGRWIVRDCDYLETVTLHNGLNTLSESTFSGCGGITSIHIPTTVTEIPAYCFSNCQNLERIYLHDGVTSIGTEAFFNCYSLKSFTAPQSLTVLSDFMFHQCKSLELVTLHDGITEFGAGCFYLCISLRELMTPREKGGDSQWPRALQKMGEEVFYNSGLVEAFMAETQLTEIPASAFSGCNNLIQASLPEQLEKIWNDAFASTAISGLDIPSTIQSLGNSVFSGCNNVTMITCHATTAPTIQTSTFPESFKETCTLYYPKDSNYSAWTSYFKKTMDSL